MSAVFASPVTIMILRRGDIDDARQKRTSQAEAKEKRRQRSVCGSSMCRSRRSSASEHNAAEGAAGCAARGFWLLVPSLPSLPPPHSYFRLSLLPPLTAASSPLPHPTSRSQKHGAPSTPARYTKCGSAASPSDLLSAGAWGLWLPVALLPCLFASACALCCVVWLWSGYFNTLTCCRAGAFFHLACLSRAALPHTLSPSPLSRIQPTAATPRF